MASTQSHNVSHVITFLEDEMPHVCNNFQHLRRQNIYGVRMHPYTAAAAAVLVMIKNNLNSNPIFYISITHKTRVVEAI